MPGSVCVYTATLHFGYYNANCIIPSSSHFTQDSHLDNSVMWLKLLHISQWTNEQLQPTYSINQGCTFALFADAGSNELSSFICILFTRWKMFPFHETVIGHKFRHTVSLCWHIHIEYLGQWLSNGPNDQWILF
jgi:hypothetical protein